MTIDSIATVVLPQGTAKAPAQPKAAPGAVPEAAQPAQAQAVVPEQSEGEPPSAEALQAAVKQIESYLKGSERSLEFKVDEASGRTVISVRDAASGDLIRQIPSEEALRLARSLGSGSKSLIEIVA